MAVVIATAACNAGREDTLSIVATATPSPVAETAATADAGTPLLTSTRELTPTPAQDDSTEKETPLYQYAMRHAHGPGAIYVGDLTQLAGPAVTDEFMPEYGALLADADGNVPLYAIEEHLWIFESAYYRSLLNKAKLTDPALLTSKGERIEIRHACANRFSNWCNHLEAYFAPNVERRTGGQVKLKFTSFPEIDVRASNMSDLLADGELEMAEVHEGYVGDTFPAWRMPLLPGLWPDRQTHYAALANIAPELDQVIPAEMNSRPLMRNWIGGYDNFFFSTRRLETLKDFDGLKVSTSYQLWDWADSTGANANRIHPPVHTALVRGINEAVLVGANFAFALQLHEVTGYMAGPLYNFPFTVNAINRELWGHIPTDLQQIPFEEGAKHELESLPLSAIQIHASIQGNLDEGLEYLEFSTDIKRHGFGTGVIEHVIPAWLKRIDYPNYNQNLGNLFNENTGTFIGLRIEQDGSVAKVPITQGPHTGKTMAEVLSE